MGLFGSQPKVDTYADPPMPALNADESYEDSLPGLPRPSNTTIAEGGHPCGHDERRGGGPD